MYGLRFSFLHNSLAEFLPPAELLQSPASLFSKLVDDTGKESAAMLRSIAFAKAGLAPPTPMSPARSASARFDSAAMAVVVAAAATEEKSPSATAVAHHDTAVVHDAPAIVEAAAMAAEVAPLAAACAAADSVAVDPSSVVLSDHHPIDAAPATAVTAVASAVESGEASAGTPAPQAE